MRFCTNLSHLKFSGFFDTEFISFLRTLPSDIMRNLTFRDPDVERCVNGLLELLDSVNLGKLNQVILENITRKEFLRGERGREALTGWQKRGVELVFEWVV